MGKRLVSCFFDSRCIMPRGSACRNSTCRNSACRNSAMYPYKQYKEYFERICECNGWNNSTERARHLLVAMDGAACEAVRGLKAEQDSDLALIWESLDRRFGYVDEPRTMRRFDVRRQLQGETLAVFEQSLCMLYREAWPKTDPSRPRQTHCCVGSLLMVYKIWIFKKYLRLHAAQRLTILPRQCLRPVTLWMLVSWLELLKSQPSAPPQPALITRP